MDRDRITRAQHVLASAAPGLTVDGDIGEQTRRAAYGALEGIKTDDGAMSTLPRLLTAAMQAVLAKTGFEPGAIDGYWGHNTAEALYAWEFSSREARREIVTRTATTSYRPPSADDLPRQRECVSFYGAPGPEVQARLGSAMPPCPLPLDWDLNSVARTLRVHEKCVVHLEHALIAVKDHYGWDQMTRLGINRYAGGYNHRRMRGGAAWSMHAYGCAIDIYAAPNGLRTRCPSALFCRPEYTPFLDIMEAHGWLPAIRLWGADAMHFQMARM